jgi:hypothetical protein
MKNGELASAAIVPPHILAGILGEAAPTADSSLSIILVWIDLVREHRPKLKHGGGGDSRAPCSFLIGHDRPYAGTSDAKKTGNSCRPGLLESAMLTRSVS